MNKPDWKDAPAWANYLAMDADGCWFWYEVEPTFQPYNELWGDVPKTLVAPAYYSAHAAETSLESRPVCK